jgi:hypothetical protein
VIGLVTCAEITREPVCRQADNILIWSIQVGQQTCDLEDQVRFQFYKISSKRFKKKKTKKDYLILIKKKLSIQ